MATQLQGTQLSLYNQFRPALENYHTGGFKNGGGVDGVQLPPNVSQDQLEPYMDAVCTYMAQQPGIDVLPPTPDGMKDSAWRHQFGVNVESTVRANTQSYIKTGLAMIHNPAIAGMIQQALDAAPKGWFDAPSSLSGQFHPADEVIPAEAGGGGGLVLHSLRNMIVADKLVDFFNADASVNVIGNQHIDSDTRDMIVGAELLHDIEKDSTPDLQTWGRYNPGHGPLGQSFLQGVWKDAPNQEWASKMEEMVNGHMAQWNVDPTDNKKKEPIVPKDVPNQIFSYADYLGSQRNVLVQPSPGVDE
ncbi:MAG TPA: hypothetical protein VGO93_24345 [Candidatus Xenobia bacterium]|jgi:hypothetical protein